ncbi:flagellar protein FliT [Thioalkalicoccus limnaeus]|uniref:Flagellar protein FliT n=1 Tax=Thioalkalicoccus limnaeus TaxID=120681 RepID=A0ABV4BEG3_9GAMM
MNRLSLVDTTRPVEWDGILADTRAMLEAAQAGDWERVMRLERERQPRIERFFAAEPGPHETTWVRRGIEEILVSDEAVLTLCQAGRSAASSKILDLRHKAAANRVYERTAAV